MRPALRFDAPCRRCRCRAARARGVRLSTTRHTAYYLGQRRMLASGAAEREEERPIKMTWRIRVRRLPLGCNRHMMRREVSVLERDRGAALDAAAGDDDVAAPPRHERKRAEGREAGARPAAWGGERSIDGAFCSLAPHCCGRAVVHWVQACKRRKQHAYITRHGRSSRPRARPSCPRS